MKKIIQKVLLGGGILASVAFSADACQGCQNGRFYIGVNFGVSRTMTEYESNATKKVIASINPDAKILTLTIKNAGGNVISTGKYYAADDVNQSFVEGETSHKKNKMKLMADFGVGYEMRLKKFVIGAEASFCKKFGTVKNTFMLSPLQLIDASNALKADSAERSYTAANIVNATNGGVLDKSTLTNPDGGDDLTGIDLNNVRVIPVETAHLAHLFQFSIKYKSNWGMSFKPRIGYMVTPKLEVYATGGLKISESKISGGFDIDQTNDAPGISASIFRTEVSPIIGGGLIYSFNDNLFARLEYNFNAKSKSSLNVPPLSSDSLLALLGSSAGKTTGNVITHKFRNRSHDIKLGIGYRF